MAKLKVESVVFCENFRAELNGKYTLLGASANHLTINEVPVHVAVALFIVGTPDGAGDFKARVRVKDRNEKDLIKGEFGGTFRNAETTSMPFGPILLPIEKDGPIRFEWCFNEDQWEEVATLHFHVVPPTT
jgi:hypothetical protein